jgi:hypothetical protein
VEVLSIQNRRDVVIKRDYRVAPRQLLRIIARAKGDVMDGARPSDRASILADTKGPQMRLGRRRGRESAGALPRRQTPHNQTSQ